MRTLGYMLILGIVAQAAEALAQPVGPMPSVPFPQYPPPADPRFAAPPYAPVPAMALPNALPAYPAPALAPNWPQDDLKFHTVVPAAPACGPTLSDAQFAHQKGKRTFAFGFGGSFSEESYQGNLIGSPSSSFALSASFGVFLADNLQLGISVGGYSFEEFMHYDYYEFRYSPWLGVQQYAVSGTRSVGRTTVLDCEVTLKYYFANSTILVPYVGAQVGVTSLSNGALGPRSAASFGGMLGLELMCGRSQSVAFEFNALAFGDGKGFTQVRSEALAGMCFYF